jgi:hypothetical protein
MSFQAYIDNIKAKTGKTPEDFAKLAARNGLTKHGEIVTWLKRAPAAQRAPKARPGGRCRTASGPAPAAGTAFT